MATKKAYVVEGLSSFDSEHNTIVKVFTSYDRAKKFVDTLENDVNESEKQQERCNSCPFNTECASSDEGCNELIEKAKKYCKICEKCNLEVCKEGEDIYVECSGHTVIPWEDCYYICETELDTED